MNGAIIWAETSTNTLMREYLRITPSGSAEVRLEKQDSGMSAKLYFKYVKKKFTLLQSNVFARRVDKLMSYSKEAEERGQIALSEPCYDIQSGYYSSDLELVITQGNLTTNIDITSFILEDHN